MHPSLSAALTERGYDALTDVQEAVTAPELAGADLLVSAQTGSGKTVGFGLAMADTLLGDAEVFGPAAEPMALIVAPTRELALQVMRELQWLYAKAGARVVSCVGGMDMRDERRALARGAHIVVGTPGRLRDHIERESLVMDAMRVIVLDEADEMLDLGFREDLEFMLAEAPEERRILLFSATVPPMIAKLAATYQRDAIRVSTTSGAKQHADIAYQAVRVASKDSETAIFNLLRFHDAENAIIFGNTRASVNHLTARLANRGFAVVSLSGELSQSERSHALQAMRDGRARVCVATDVAARGIDLPGLELVIHADLPSNAEGLLHRSGRTGRAGRKGISALIIPPKAVKKAERLLKFAKITAEWTVAPSADAIRAKDEEKLLTDPVWSESPSEDEAAFAAKLLSAHSPEAIAAAYLRLYRANLSAPEELSDPDVAPKRKDKEAFGPSRWFRLSVGRNKGAEPRWLLPMVLRSAGLDKEAIGAIRVQYDETFMEVAEASAPALTEWLAAGNSLDQGIELTELAEAPDLSAPRPGPPSDGRPPRREREDRPRKPRDAAPAPKPRADRRADAPKPPRKPGDAWKDKPTYDKPRRGPKGDSPAGAGPKGAAPKKPHRGKTEGAKPGKAEGKPATKPERKGPPKGAADPSQRMERPGAKPRGKPGPGNKGKPGGPKSGGKPRGPRGGDARPMRGKRP